MYKWRKLLSFSECQAVKQNLQVENKNFRINEFKPGELIENETWTEISKKIHVSADGNWIGNYQQTYLLTRNRMEKRKPQLTGA